MLSATGARGQTSQPTVQGPEHYDVSPPLRDMPASTGVKANKRVIVVRHGSVPGRPIVVHDPARQTLAGPLVNTTGGLNFDAQANADSVAPPDTNMAVGPNHIVQWVNLSLAIYDKSGNILPGYPKEGNTIWTGFGGDCDP
ncbi:MAG TPA: hypothetical protein VEV17_22050, partial [Bryobacteraceae bacterium]|nr:hypothetical protein [Bryobacteraceae bacterium]